ncbi:hypothetical protein KFL_000840260, partial [Klebsormidium nitens]
AHHGGDAPVGRATGETPPNGHVAFPRPLKNGCDPDDFFDYFTEEEVDFEPTPEPSPKLPRSAQADVIPAVRPPPSADRRPVHQRLGSPVRTPERRPISERLTVPVQEERVPIADCLGPTNRPNLQGRLGTPNPSPPTGPTESNPGDRLLALAAKTEEREAIELSSHLEGFSSLTLAPRSRLRLVESTWGAHCADPNNICLGRTEDLDCMEGIQAQIAEAMEAVQAAKWQADFTKAREEAQAKAAAVSSVPTVTIGAEFKLPKGKRPANRRGGKGKKGALRPSSGKQKLAQDGSRTTPLERSSTTTSVVTTKAISTSVRTVSRKSRWDV